jgi:hypothetical protein
MCLFCVSLRLPMSAVNWSTRISQLCGRGGFVYAATFGASLGVAAAGMCFVYRVGKVYLFDEQYNQLISRQRYLEKQTVFFANLQNKLKAQAMAHSLVSQFNPVDLKPVLNN